MDWSFMRKPRLVEVDGQVFCGLCLADSIRERTTLAEASRFENADSIRDSNVDEYQLRKVESGYERRAWSPFHVGAWEATQERLLICCRCQEAGPEMKIVPFDAVTGELVEGQGYLGWEYHRREAMGQK